MFIYNLKINGTKAYKLLLGLFVFIICILIVLVCFTLLKNNNFKVNDELKKEEVFELNPQNYTNVLKNVHENLDSYIGQKVKFSGFIYRLYDFKDNEFVLGRHMLISSDYKAVVVGFLCDYSKAKEFEDNTWVEIEGIIKKGSYHGEIPVIKIKSINKIEPPSEEYVYPPDESFVTTSTVL